VSTGWAGSYVPKQRRTLGARWTMDPPFLFLAVVFLILFFFELAFFISFYSKQPRRKRKEARTGEVARGPRQGAAVCCAQAVGWIPISIRISFFSHSFLILAKLGILFCIKNLYSCS
jgi:hypothetical protein